MTAVPETRYARSGDVHIAYQVVGDGPRDLVMVPGWFSHLELNWEKHPSVSWADFLRGLASFSRLILFDKRGTGLSDRAVGVPTLEQHMDDLRAVMDAAGSERAAIFGDSEGGPMCALFAATYPQRTTALIVYGGYAKVLASADYDCGFTREALEQATAFAERQWGHGELTHFYAPSLAQDAAAREFIGRYERLAASPGSARAEFLMYADIDIRPILPTIRVPTLVLHRIGDRMVSVCHGRYLAQHIPGARYVELPGDDHAPFVDPMAIVGEVEEFLTGVRHAPVSDRVLTTLLFTDIVGSTQRAAELGDERWRRLLEEHYAASRREIARFRGREVQVTGDGFLAMFDGPARAIQCARALGDAARRIGLQIRAGVHTGECELIGEHVSGIAVHVAARVAAEAGADEVLVSRTVTDLVAGSGLRFCDRGTRPLKGVPGEWQLFAVET